VISLISYDAHLLPKSIASYYDYVDEIVLGLDKDRISWSNNTFTFDEESLWRELSAIDKDDKINVIEDNFHRSRVPIENDTHERNFLKSKCEHDWVFSFDADEILVNAEEFFMYFCPIVQDYKDVELLFTWFSMYKELDDSFLIIADENRNRLFKKDVQGFTANRDLSTFTYCRWTNSEKRILSPLAIEHYSFCRTDKELEDKINNFGHSSESKNDVFYEVQKKVNKLNYENLYNFKTTAGGEQWPTLRRVAKSELKKVLKEEARFIYA
jgi:hypothetical protein